MVLCVWHLHCAYFFFFGKELGIRFMNTFYIGRFVTQTLVPLRHRGPKCEQRMTSDRRPTSSDVPSYVEPLRFLSLEPCRDSLNGCIRYVLAPFLFQILEWPNNNIIIRVRNTGGKQQFPELGNCQENLRFCHVSIQKPKLRNYHKIYCFLKTLQT